MHELPRNAYKHFNITKEAHARALDEKRASTKRERKTHSEGAEKQFWHPVRHRS